MRRLAELLKTGFHSSRRAGMSLAVVSLLAATILAFGSLAHAQTIITNDFEDGSLGLWYKNGSPTTLEVSTDMAHSGGHSMKVAGRTNGWDGAALQMKNIATAGQAWYFEVWVRLAPGAAADKVQLQFHDASASNQYPVVVEANVTDKDWVRMTGRYPASGTLPGGATDLNLYFNVSSGATDYYVDDFVAYAQQPSGCSKPADTAGVQTGFESGLEGWLPRAWSNATATQTTADAHTGTHSLLESTRTGNWTVDMYDVTGKICNGSRYMVSVWAKMAPNMPDTKMSLAGELKKTGASSAYPTFISSQTVTANGWTEFKTTLDMLQDYDSLSMYLQPDTDSTSQFYVDDFSITYVPPAATIEQIPSIAQAYKTSFPVGAAVYAPDVTNGDAHADLLALHFNSVTPENDMKWSATEPTENAFDYSKADAIVSFATSHNMAVRGHTMVWHQQTPDWVFKDADGVDMSTLPYSDANKALLFSRMNNHIQSLITHFGADVTSWDVVNEAFDESQTDGFRHSKWYIIAGGPSYIDEAFKDAKQALADAGLDGKVKLYLNDYNTTVPAKLSFITSYLTAAKTAGVPIDGVGHQFHNKLDWPINDDPASINAVTGAIDAIAALGFDNQVTEMEISIYRNGTGTTYQAYADIVANLQNDLTIQGYRYHDYFAAFKQLATAGKLSSVTLWGEADDHTWLTSLTKADAPLPFDNNLIHKAAYTGIMDSTSLPNALPQASDASVTVSFDTAKAITLPASDANQDALSFTIVTGPDHGTLSAASGSQVTYTPTAGYFGPDSFTFTANDGKGDSNLGQVNITVFPAPPVAQDQSVTVNTNVAKAISLVATGDGTLAWTVLTQPAHGTLSGTAPALTYTPAADYEGSDSFTFKVNNSLDSNIATVSINVVLGAPVAADQAVTTNFNTAKAITLSATGFGTISYAVVAQPAHGTLTGTAPNVTYAPAKDYFGPDSFTFKANNGTDSNIATVSITVLADVPVAKDQSITVDYLTPTLIKLSATGNGPFTYSIVKMPKGKGTLTATAQPDTFLYTNDADISPYMTTPPLDVNLDSIEFKANNGHDSQVGTVSITIKPAALKVTPASGQPTSQTISAGGTATYNLRVNGYMNYSKYSMPGVTFVCGGVPNFASCTVTPGSVTLDDQMTAVPFTVVVKTNTGAAAAASTSTTGTWPRMPWLTVALLATFALALTMTRKAKMQWRLVGACAVLAVVAAFPGCGGGSTKTTTSTNTASTPAGTYTVTVTAVATRNISGVPQSDWKIVGDMPLTLKVN